MPRLGHTESGRSAVLELSYDPIYLDSRLQDSKLAFLLPVAEKAICCVVRSFSIKSAASKSCQSVIRDRQMSLFGRGM